MLVSDDNLSHSVKLSRKGAIGLCSGNAAILERLMTFFGLEGVRESGKCVSRTGRLPGQRQSLLRSDESHGVSKKVQ
jgi:hypothetical protein